jgi:hypothetical protein
MQKHDITGPDTKESFFNRPIIKWFNRVFFLRKVVYFLRYFSGGSNIFFLSHIIVGAFLIIIIFIFIQTHLHCNLSSIKSRRVSYFILKFISI